MTSCILFNQYRKRAYLARVPRTSTISFVTLPSCPCSKRGKAGRKRKLLQLVVSWKTHYVLNESVIVVTWHFPKRTNSALGQGCQPRGFSSRLRIFQLLCQTRGYFWGFQYFDDFLKINPIKCKTLTNILLNISILRMSICCLNSLVLESGLSGV